MDLHDPEATLVCVGKFSQDRGDFLAGGAMIAPEVHKDGDRGFQDLRAKGLIGDISQLRQANLRWPAAESLSSKEEDVFAATCSRGNALPRNPLTVGRGAPHLGMIQFSGQLRLLGAISRVPCPLRRILPSVASRPDPARSEERHRLATGSLIGPQSRNVPITKRSRRTFGKRLSERALREDVSQD